MSFNASHIYPRTTQPSVPVPVIWKAPRGGWHMRVKDGTSVWGLTYGGGITSPWWRPTRAMAQRKARSVIRSIIREREARAREQAAIHPRCRYCGAAK